MLLLRANTQMYSCIPCLIVEDYLVLFNGAPSITCEYVNIWCVLMVLTKQCGLYLELCRCTIGAEKMYIPFCKTNMKYLKESFHFHLFCTSSYIYFLVFCPIGQETNGFN